MADNEEEVTEAPEGEKVTLAGADESKAEAFERVANPEQPEPLYAEPLPAEAVEEEEEDEEEEEE